MVEKSSKDGTPGGAPWTASEAPRLGPTLLPPTLLPPTLLPVVLAGLPPGAGVIGSWVGMGERDPARETAQPAGGS